MVIATNALLPNCLARLLFSAGRRLRAPSARRLDTPVAALPGLLLVASLALPLPSWALVIGFHEVSSTSAANQVGSIAVPVPAGTRTGDLMLAAVSARGGSNVTIGSPAGWTAIPAASDGNLNSGTTLRTALFYRVALAADTSSPSYTWTFSTNQRGVAAIVVYRGVDTANPIIDAINGQANASSVTITAPTLTPSVTTALLVGFFSTARDTTVTPQASMLDRFSDNTGTGTAGNGVTLDIADEQLSSAAATGNRTATAPAGNAAVNIGQLVALRPQTTVPNPLLWYRMDEASWNGTAGEVKDSGTAVLNGTALGGATTAAGVKCRAGSFSGSPTRVDVGYNTKMDMQSTFTVTGWIRPSVWPGSDLMSFFSKDTNYEFHVDPTGRINWWWGGGTQSLFTPNNTAPLNQWTFVAAVFTRGSQNIYLGNTTTAVSSSISGTDTQQLTLNALKLQIGDDQDFGGGTRRWNGLIDDMRVYDYALTQSEVDAIRTSNVPCAVDHYRVQNNATGVNCQAETVTVTAHDASHNAVNLNNATTITVTAAFVSGAGAGSRGDWSLITGGGTLNNGTADDGIATYTFAAGGESTIVLALKDTWAQTVNIAVTDGLATDVSGTASADTGYNQNLTFNAAGFRFVDASNNLIPNQVAGVTSASLSLQAIQSSACGPTGACTGVCTAAPGFASGSNVSVDLASECVNPTTCQAGQLVSITNTTTSTIAGNNSGSVSSYTTKSLLFGANAIAAFTLSYPDVGSIRLYARYNIPLGTGGASSNNMTGTSNSFVVKPYSFVVSNVKRTSDSFANPGAANASGAVFIGAGNAFTATVTAVNRANAATPNYGKETVPETARLISTLAGGLGLTVNPSIANNTAFGAFSSGAATGTTFSWAEVGIVTLSAGVGDSDYLGAGDASVFTQSGNVGRFIPDHFVLSGSALTNRVAAACSPASSFTYMSEGIGLTYTLTAVTAGASPTTTQNYTTANSFAKLPTTPGTASPASTLGYGAVSGSTNLTSRLDLSVSNAITWTAGQATVNATVGIARAATPDGPYPNLKIGIAPSDQDGVGLLSSAFNVDVDSTGGNDHAQVGASTEARFGRLRLGNATGSELLDLPIPADLQYWSGSGGFATNAADSCTTLTNTDIALSNFLGNLSACETTVRPTGTLSFAAGKGTLRLTKPGSGNYGSVDLMANLGTASGTTCTTVGASTVAASGAGNKLYLQGNWGGAAGYNVNPAARATFGQYRNTQEFIYLRENH
jgi:Concanavalin A-like lectin/glucanases superfamily